MLKRKISEQLNEWRSSGRDKCLIVEGARQVGKTFIIREFGRSNYESFIELNFLENPSLQNIFSGDLDPGTILTGISLYMPGVKIISGETLLFLDEVQECPQAVTSLKFLAADERIDVVCSGSALGMIYNQVTSYPVGSAEHLMMYALDFEEFLWAIGVSGDAIAEIRGYFPDPGETPVKLPSAIHDKMMQYLRQYIVIGGMPETVQTFIDSSDYYAADLVQRRLYQDYLLDIARYARPEVRIRAEKCYRAVPQQLAKDNHKFQYSKVEHNGTSGKFETCIDWLENAHMVVPVHNVARIEYPLGAFAVENNFRLYYHDIGMLISTYGYELKAAILNDRDFDSNPDNIVLGTAKGGIYEALAADILHKAGYNDLHFYRNETGTREMEFLIENSDGVIPLEIKAGRTGTKSMNAILKDDRIHYGYKFASQNAGLKDRKYTLPLYLMMFL